jgi:hypothetical protein
VAIRDDRPEVNQRMFRGINERMRTSASGAGVTDQKSIPFLCECADEACLGRLVATMEQFERAHLDPDHYVILPGHATVEGEEIVERNDGFDTVRKGRDELWIG